MLNYTPLSKAKPPGFSSTEFRASLAMFATGVTIVTARTASGELVGLTANSFNSVSLSPPLVLWSLSQAASSLAAFSTGSHYAINILAADQKDLAERFASKRAHPAGTSVRATRTVAGCAFSRTVPACSPRRTPGRPVGLRTIVPMVAVDHAPSCQEGCLVRENGDLGE
jgi:hypothetical protein